MKTILAFACVALLGASAHHLSPEEKQKLKEFHHSCQANPSTKVDEQLLIKLSENIDDPKVGAHLLCMSVKIGLQKENGDLDEKVIKNKVALVTHDQSKVDGLVDKCAIVQETPKKTAVLLFLCFIQNDIHYVPELGVHS